MNQKQLKIDFRKKCKEEKRKNYRYTMMGMIVTFFGLLLALVILLLDQFTTVFLYPWPIILYAVGTIVAIAGMVLEGIGEYNFNKEFKTYALNMKQEKNKIAVKEEEKKTAIPKTTSNPVKKTAVQDVPKIKNEKEKTNRPKPNTQQKKQGATKEKKVSTTVKSTSKKSASSNSQNTKRKVNSTKKVESKTKRTK